MRRVLSFAQQRLWILDQIEPGSAAYNNVDAVRLRGRLDAGALAASLTEIVRRHEVLRTRFEAEAGLPRQVIGPAGAATLERVDLRGLPAVEHLAEVRRRARQQVHEPCDLAVGPLLRACLLQLGDDDHVLLFSIHHIVSDGWSMGVFTREVAALYPAFREGRPSPLPELPLQYADFASWQRTWLQGAALESRLGYWRKQLAAAPPVLDLPTDHPRPPRQTFRGGTILRPLPRGLSDAVRAVSQREGVTPFMTLLAVFQVLLGRYTRQEDVVVGTPIANRSRSELEGLIGFFVNTLALRVDLSGDPTFRDLLGRVRHVALEGFAHQDVSFEQIVDALQPARDLGRHPLFQVLFALQNAPMGALELPGLVLESLELPSATSKFDLSLYVLERGGSLLAAMEYNVDLFEADTAGRMLEQYERLLEAAVGDPGRRVAELPLLDGREEERVLVAWNRTAEEWAGAETIPEAFEERVERHPGALAYVFEGRRLGYGELNAQANRLARRLRRRGVVPESRVALWLERSPETMVALLAVAKTGAAYVPIDPRYPQERVAFMLEDAGARLVLTQAALRSRLPRFDGDILCTDAEAGAWAGEAATNLPPLAAADSAAYVIYTSGSTGRPKGVVGTHRGALNRFRWMWRAWPFREGEVCCQKTSSSFVDSVWECFGPLLAGVPTVGIPEATAADPVALVEALARHAVTRVVVVPALLRAMLDAHPDQGERLPALDHWVTSGEALPLELARRFHAALPGRTLLNLYGSSEVSADVTVYDTAADPSHVFIGRPIANTRVHVLDVRLRPAPVGVPGELLCGGDGLARGYLGRPDLTAERFVPDPVGTVPGARLYRTGDLARYRPDGQLEYLGRLDHQVKVGGVRIEMAEVEAVLVQHAGVSAALVDARRDAAGLRLVAYVVGVDGARPAAADLRQFLRDRLPESMIPSALVVLDALPLTPNGKVDRRALPAPQVERPEGHVAVAPRTPEERALARIWREVLGVEDLSVHDNFFGAGGDSIRAIQIAARARGVGLGLSPRQVFEHQTLARLAAVAALLPLGEATAATSPVTPVTEGDFPLARMSARQLGRLLSRQQATETEVEP
jgi:amino acid adenylation domain-containing protein